MCVQIFSRLRSREVSRAIGDITVAYAHHHHQEIKSVILCVTLGMIHYANNIIDVALQHVHSPWYKRATLESSCCPGSHVGSGGYCTPHTITTSYWEIYQTSATTHLTITKTHMSRTWSPKRHMIAFPTHPKLYYHWLMWKTTHSRIVRLWIVYTLPFSYESIAGPVLANAVLGSSGKL